MGSYNEAEICKLAELYLLDWWSTFIDKSGADLYIDDGLTAINNANDLKLDRIRKESITLFTEEE